MLNESRTMLVRIGKLAYPFYYNSCVSIKLLAKQELGACIVFTSEYITCQLSKSIVLDYKGIFATSPFVFVTTLASKRDQHPSLQPHNSTTK